MGSFNRSYSGGRGRGDRNFASRGPRPMMHKAVCSNCGKECEVPFKPTGEKPVYCRDCFREMGGAETKRSDERQERSFSRLQFENKSTENSQLKQEIASLNAKVDKILSILTSAISPEETEEETVVEEVTQPKEAASKKKRTSKKAL